MMKRRAEGLNRGMLQAWQQWWADAVPRREGQVAAGGAAGAQQGPALGWTSWLEDYEEARRKKEEVKRAPLPPPPTRCLPYYPRLTGAC